MQHFIMGSWYYWLALSESVHDVHPGKILNLESYNIIGQKHVLTRSYNNDVLMDLIIIL